MDHCEKQIRKTDPRTKANFLSLILFGYTGKLFAKGFKNDLEDEDMYDVIKKCGSKRCGDKLESEWEKEKQKHPKSPSVFRVLWICFGVRYIILGLIQLCWRLTNGALEPAAMEKLISYFKANQTKLTKDDAIFYAGVLIGLHLFHCLYFQNYQIFLQELAIQIRTSFSSLIYRKSLKLCPTGKSSVSLGNVITLLCKDMGTFEHAMSLFNDFWIAVIESVMTCYLIYNKIGPISLIGISITLLILPLQAFLAKLLSKMRIKINKTTDNRLQVTQETLSAIKIVKMYTWERFFENKVGDARKKEMLLLMKSFYLKIILIIFGIISSKFGFYFLVMTHLWLGLRHNLNAGIIFYIMSCFHRLRHATGIVIPYGLARGAELYASITRIKNVLLAEELIDRPETNCETNKPIVELKNVHVEIRDKPILTNVSMIVQTTGLTIVTGPLGCGKSSLLKAILYDYPANKGEVVTRGRTSYASQDPWLFPSSIKQNILFGQKYNEIRYQEVVEVCALQYDFDLFEKGDETIVADRGMNLSKGQQARINLARAVYKESEIYLFDDSLTALDSHVQETIFTKCIKQYLKDKICILVSHNPQHIDQADNIVVLNEGTIQLIGGRNDLSPTEVYKYLEKEATVDNSCKENEEIEDACPIEEATLIKRLSTKNEVKKNIYKEVKQKGSVHLDVYKRYFQFGGGILGISIIGITYFIAQFTESTSTKIFSNWVNFEQNVTALEDINSTNSTEYLDAVYNSKFSINIYTITLVLSALLELFKTYIILNFARKASVNIHKSMVGTIIRSVMSFFDTYFIGNILNRFSQDLNIIDEHFPYNLMTIAREIFEVIGVVILIATVNYSFLLPSLIFVVVLVLLRFFYMPTARSLKRIEAATRSPLVGHLNSSMEGVTTIRAYKAQNILKDEFDRHQDLFTAASYTSFGTRRAFGFYLDFCAVIYTGTIINWFLFGENHSESGDVGLAITQASDLARKVQWGIIQWTNIENLMTSVERVLEYTHLTTESTAGDSVENWPQNGAVNYNNVTLTYANSNEKVLKNISFNVEPKQKIGIVGRTGAGKSSIISTLFRLYDFEGTVTIDNVDTKTVALEHLRSNIAIIPQDPVLFAGSIRDNIDPLKKYTDEDIWNAFERVSIKEIIPSLELIVSDGGSSHFSTGQRQLICLARAIVRKNKIVILDEATANMDPETDALIQTAIKKNFEDCTVFTIAHRLNTVLDCDKVMVLEKGSIIEYDEPANLLLNVNGVFYNMTKQAGLLDSYDQK